MSNSYSDPQSVANHSISRSFTELLKPRLSRRQVLKGATLLPLLGLPLEYDEPDPAPDFDDDECDDDEYGPFNVLAELIRGQRNPDARSGYGSARSAGRAGATPGGR